jgi:hypothetical protein
MRATVTLMLKLHPYGSCREERQGPQLAPTGGSLHATTRQLLGVERTYCNHRRTAEFDPNLPPDAADWRGGLSKTLLDWS